MRLSSPCIRRCSFFTLVEMLIVLTILSVVAGGIGINIYQALEEQRFRTEVEAVVNELRLAQDLMLVLQADVTLKILQGKNGINFTLETESQATKNWMNELLRVKPTFKTIRGISFKDELDLPVKEGVITLHFLSKGGVMSRGILRLSSSPNTLTAPSGSYVRVINLYGYPHPIASTAPLPADPVFLPNEDKVVEAVITRLIKQEIAEFKESMQESKDEELSTH